MKLKFFEHFVQNIGKVEQEFQKEASKKSSNKKIPNQWRFLQNFVIKYVYALHNFAKITIDVHWVCSYVKIVQSIGFWA